IVGLIRYLLSEATKYVRDRLFSCARRNSLRPYGRAPDSNSIRRRSQFRQNARRWTEETSRETQNACAKEPAPLCVRNPSETSEASDASNPGAPWQLYRHGRISRTTLQSGTLPRSSGIG